jgi:hypothetical protein
MFSSLFPIFWNNPTENTDSPKLLEIVSLNPKLCCRFMMNNNYHQQAPPSLTFASPLPKLNLANLD